MEVNCWCTCTSYNCKNQYDIAQHKHGVMVSRRAFETHQKADSVAELQKRAEASYSKALAEQEKEIIRKLERMALKEEAKSSQREADGIAQTLDVFGQINDIITGIGEDVKSLGPGSQAPTLRIVEAALDRCNVIRLELNDQRRRAGTLAGGAYRKKQSVKSMRYQFEKGYQEVHDLLDVHERSWSAAYEKCQATSESYLEKGRIFFDSTHHFVEYFSGVKTALQAIILMIVSCNIILGLPRRGTYWLFSMISYILEIIIFKVYRDQPPAYWTDLVNGIPRDIRTAARHFSLDGKSTILAACPKCNATYPPELEGGIPTYRKKCNYRKYGSRCKEMLVRPKHNGNFLFFTPIKPYIAFDMQDWMAALLSREGYEKKLDAAWSRMAPPADGILTDIFQGSVIRDLKGFDGRTHFSSLGGDEAGRYLFSLCCDFFNPLGNRQAGKKISVGILVLACLNFPIEMRYKPENLFLAGIIPGPEEPKLDSINHFLKPLVDVLLLFWLGVLFSQTSMYPSGRLILCALVVIVCDLPAARKIAGFASYSHHFFCSSCWCDRQNHTYNNFNTPEWRPRTNGDCRMHAESFRTASTEKDALKSFNLSGLRYSELLRLSYFDPSKMVVVDPMHNLFLGLVMEHFKNILGYRPKESQASTISADIIPSAIDIYIVPSNENPLPEKSQEKASVFKLIKILSKPINTSPDNAEDYLVEKIGGKKSSIHVAALMYVTRGLGLVGMEVKRKCKRDLAEIVVAWRMCQQEREIENDTWLSRTRGRIFTTEEMEELWHDLKSIVKPSWVSSVPPKLSSVGPKLKSDEWRSLASIYLPITLIRMWSNLNDQYEHATERRQLLHLTMLLCSAISIAGSRITSESHGRLFRSYMAEYRQELERLFPKYICHPNHHFALHIPDLMLMYGPVHGWWAFPFERVIGMLQRINTNYKQGEYETTIAASWARASNLRAFFTKVRCPPTIRLCHDMFSKLVQPAARNSLALVPESGDDLIDIDSDKDEDDYSDDIVTELSPKLTSIPLSIVSAFTRTYPNAKNIPSKATLVNHVIWKGISYSTSIVHQGNSGILQKSSSTPLCIENILIFPEDSRSVFRSGWLIVRAYKEIQVKNDPYQQYPHLRAKMWSTELAPALEVIPLANIGGHFAKHIICWEGEDVAVIISLTRAQNITITD